MFQERSPEADEAEFGGNDSDSMARLRRDFALLAKKLGAREFTAFLSARIPAGHRLVPFLDSAFPGIAPLTVLATSATMGTALEGASGRVSATFWGHRREGLSLAHQGAPIDRELEILAFPARCPAGRAGLAVLAGPALTIDDETLCEAHADCYGLLARLGALRPEESRPAVAVSRRETECLQLTAAGLTSEEIAAALGLSVHTANRYLSTGIGKLDAVNRMHAVAKAIRSGLID